jgi:hypothetical protein
MGFSQQSRHRGPFGNGEMANAVLGSYRSLCSPFTDHVCPLSPAWFSQATPYGIAEADGSLTCDKGNGGRLPPGFRCHSGFAVQLYAGIEDVASRKSWRNH